MTSLADRTITALLDHHDALAEIVPNLSDADLSAPSGASEWSVAQVLSHIGSGAELTLDTHRAAIDGGPMPDPARNQAVWDRWNEMRPHEQAAAFLEHDELLVETFESLTVDQRQNLKITLPFLPEPVGVETTAGMRLNEVALHSWDVRVALDPMASLDEEAAEVLAEQLTGGLSFMLGFIGKTDVLDHPAVVDAGRYGLILGDTVRLTTNPLNVTASFEGPLESFIRLIGGRLTPPHTPETLRVSGEITLDDLRHVFPGI